MRNFFRTISLFLTALFVAVGFNACSEESSSSNAFGNVKATFDKMKGDYEGQMTMPNGQRQSVSFTIDQQGNVVISSFPMDNVFNKLYPSDYQYVTPSGDALTYNCPIDSIGIPADGQLSFVTKEDLGAQRVDVSYTKDQQQHSGYMLVKTKGVYNSLLNAMTVNFIVTDLIIDSQDYTSSLCPIDNHIDIAQKK